MCKVSVIIPVYNVEKYLKRSVESVLNQTFPDFQVILVNDGSTDNSGLICDELASKDIRISVIHKENGGLSSARNAGLDTAKGDFILFIDSDDYIDSDMIKVMYEMAMNNNLDLVVCGKNDIIYDVNGNEIKKEIVPPHSIVEANEISKCFFNLLPTYLMNYACNKLYNRDLVEKEKIRFETINLVEDISFNIDYIKFTHRIGFCDKPFYNYIHYGSSTLSKRFYNDRIIANTTIYNKMILLSRYWDLSNDKRTFDIIASVYLKEITYSILTLFNTSSLSKTEKNRIISEVVTSDSIKECKKSVSVNKLYIRLMESFIKKERVRLITIYSKLWVTIKSIFPTLVTNIKKVI